MTEKPPEAKKPDISGLPRGAISIKGLPLSRNTRLPTIRSPRDLTLGAQPKKVFTPNIPARRDKKAAVSESDSSPSSSLAAAVNKQTKIFPHKNVRGKQKPRTIIQTEGSLFGDGVAPLSSKHVRPKEPVSASRFIPKKQPVKKEMDMSDLKKDLDILYNPDFVDDDEDDEDEESDDIKPVIYPVQESTLKNIKKEVKPQMFEKDFAQDMGFDVDKIAQFIKKEKDIEEIPIPTPKIDVPESAENDVIKMLKSNKTEMFLLEFPREFNVTQPEGPLSDVNQPVPKNNDKPKMSSLPEGSIGKLQVLKSGRVRLVVGDNHFYIDQGSKLHSRHEAVTIQTDGKSGDLTVLGNVDRKLTVVPDVKKRPRRRR